MNAIVLDDNPQTPYKLQQLARLKMITKLETDILADMTVCEIEGWDKLEYINQLKELINSFGKGGTEWTSTTT